MFHEIFVNGVKSSHCNDHVLLNAMITNKLQIIVKKSIFRGICVSTNSPIYILVVKYMDEVTNANTTHFPSGVYNRTTWQGEGEGSQRELLAVGFYFYYTLLPPKV